MPTSARSRASAALPSLLALALAAGCGGGGGGGGGAASTVARVSVATGRVQADGPSAQAAISPDGQWVAFSSTARNLASPGDGGRVRDVFLHSRLFTTTQKLSVDTAGGEADGDSGRPSVSSGALFVAFESLASDLVTAPDNGLLDVFVRDRAAGTTELISRDSAGGDTNGASGKPSISADGVLVAYESTATNIVVGDANGALSDIYLWSRATQTAELVSRGTDTILGMPGVQPTDAGCDSPALSGSGVIVAFASATRSFDSDPGAARDIFLRDRQFRVTERVSFKFRASTALPKLEPNGDSFSPSISYDGALVAFASDATDLVAADSNGATDVFVYNRLAQTITRVSVSSTGEQAVGGDSHSPSISQDGRYVAFVSEASNLVSGDGNARADVFVHDLVTGATTRGSRTEAGAGVNQDAEGPALSSGGQILAFSSEASNVVASDSNGESDVFTVIGPTIAP